MRTKNELKSVAEDYILLKGGNVCLNNLDTPSFIRKQSNYILSEISSVSAGKIKIVPGPITSLLNTLFGEDDIRFAY